MKPLVRRLLLPVALALSPLCSSAAAVSIGFDAFDTAEAPMPSPFFEDGFVIVTGALPGFEGPADQFLRAGNPSPSLRVFGPAPTTTLLSIQRVDGGEFSLKSFDLQLFDDRSTDLEGLVYSIQACSDAVCTTELFSEEDVLSPGTAFSTLLSPSASTMRLLNLSLHVQGPPGTATFALLDNIVLEPAATAVPEPGTPALALLGLLGLLKAGVLTRRRQRTC